ncbi:CAP domain-containing protein [Secundilactobacillus muriivasis]
MIKVPKNIALIVTGLVMAMILFIPSAKAKTTFKYYQNIKDTTCSVTYKYAPVYTTGKLTHKKGTIRSYGTKVKAYYAAHVIRDGYPYVFYKFKVGKKTGWIWNGYLREKFDEARVDARLLTLVNQRRSKAGIAPLKANKTLFDKVALVRAKQLQTNFAFQDKDGHFLALKLARDNNFNFAWLHEIIYRNADNGGIQADDVNMFSNTSNKVADNIFYDYWDHAGDKEAILDADATGIAIATASQKESYYQNVMEFYRAS